MTPKIVSRENRPYHIMLIPNDSDPKTLTEVWNDPKQASAAGIERAKRYFPGERVEVVIIHTMTREAVCIDFVEIP